MINHEGYAKAAPQSFMLVPTNTFGLMQTEQCQAELTIELVCLVGRSAQLAADLRQSADDKISQISRQQIMVKTVA